MTKPYDEEDRVFRRGVEKEKEKLVRVSGSDKRIIYRVSVDIETPTSRQLVSVLFLTFLSLFFFFSFSLSLPLLLSLFLYWWCIIPKRWRKLIRNQLDGNFSFLLILFFLLNCAVYFCANMQQPRIRGLKLVPANYSAADDDSSERSLNKVTSVFLNTSTKSPARIANPSRKSSPIS